MVSCFVVSQTVAYLSKRSANLFILKKSCGNIISTNARFFSAVKLETHQFNRENWSSTVGLEVHAQIQAKSKLFSAACTKFASPANSSVSLFDCAIPGTLPVLNQRAVEAALLTALALKCQVNLVSTFDRKHYFYADMPSGYQITQQRQPIASNGYLPFVVYNPAVYKIPFRRQSNIKQVQLEQDSGKSLHDEFVDGGSLVDLNRAGVGLMEIVFEPDLTNGEEAAALVSELIHILEKLGTCNCKMEEGSLRVDANVSVCKSGEAAGTRTEIKNLNSLRAVARSVDYEITRQIQVLEKGGKVTSETRCFDFEQKITLPMRDKEVKQDYRYLPEPNLPPLRLMQLGMDPSGFQNKIPTLPEEERTSLIEKYQMNLETAVQLVNGRGTLQYFNNVIEKNSSLPVKKVCSLLLTDLLGLLHKEDKSIDESPIRPEQFAEVIELWQNKIITNAVMQNLLAVLFHGDLRSPIRVVQDEGWEMIRDQGQLETMCQEILSTNAKHVAAYRAGKKKAFTNLMKQLNRVCNNKFEMADASETLRKLLDKRT